MTVLSNSGRQLLKATHVPLTIEDKARDIPKRAVAKATFVRGLQLQRGEVNALKSGKSSSTRQLSGKLLDLLSDFEPQPVGSMAPAASTLASVSVEDLKDFGRALLDHRTAQLRQLTSQEPSAPAPPPAVHRMSASSTRSATAQATTVDMKQSVMASSSLVTFARGALTAFEKTVEISPVGLLHLERIEMVPAGIERGELIGTVPLAPSESTSVVQKEWSVSSEEFAEIVTDYLETYSEKGVTEKTELATATESQNKHSQQLGLDTSVSGSYGFVTFSAKASFASSSSEDESKKSSRNHAEDVTSKASARVRKERKVTIQTTSTTGSENTTTRTLVNPSPTDSMRIDYYSMMRKWRVRLFQYGLRLTYDIAIPEPGATLRKQLVALAELERHISESFVFNLKRSDITPSTYMDIASQYGVMIPDPPMQPIYTTVGGVLQGLVKNETNWMFFEFPFVVPDGYKITQVSIDAMTNNTTTASGDGDGIRSLQVLGLQNPVLSDPPVDNPYIRRDLSGDPGFLVGKTGSQKITVYVNNLWKAAVTFPMKFEPTAESISRWQSDAWEAINNGARDAYYASQQSLVQQRDALKAQIENVDTLTLRQEERDEIMKGVLRWLLGPTFDFMPPEVQALFDLNSAASFTGGRLTTNGVDMDQSGWSMMFVYQEMVKFIHEAIEWENLLYFPYSYFWDVPALWDTVRTFRHPDPTRQQFLRSGSARVVLTLRPGYEEAFTAFVDNGELGSVLPPDHPYFTIGEQIRTVGATNYPGIPPANPEESYRPLLTPRQRKAWQEMELIISKLEAYKTQYGAYPATLSELSGISTTDPWGYDYVYNYPGSVSEFELSSYGANGEIETDEKEQGEDKDIVSWASANLIAEWYEYTPSQGTDIQINTASADMA